MPENTNDERQSSEAALVNIRRAIVGIAENVTEHFAESGNRKLYFFINCYNHQLT